MLDIFKQDAFSVTTLTDSINKIPFIPGRAGQIIPWAEQGVRTLTVFIEEKDGVLTLVNPTPRGGPGVTVGKTRRSGRNLTIPHYQVDDAIYADEVQGIRSFGSETELDSVQALVSQRQTEHVQWRLDPTLEYQRIGAAKGVITNGDGSTLVNLFTEFGVAQEAEIAFDLANANPASGALRKVCANVVRKQSDNLGGVSFQGIHAFCGDAFFDDLLTHKEVSASYQGTPMAQVLREGFVYPNGQKIYGAFEFGGIVWENYRGAVGGVPFVATDKAHLFPVGAPGLFKTVYAPADYIETVNTIGLPRYSRQYDAPDGKSIQFECQMNALNFCTRPKVLMVGRRGA
jgi:hypothetical protein